MAHQNFAAPRGMRDFYPEDMITRNAIFDAWRAAAIGSQFSEYDACVVESLDLLKRKSGEEITTQIYAFEDKSGRELALRPEMTPTLARMVAARQGSLPMPIKWFTVAQCFRYERMTRGRKREHYQWNLDIIGEPSVTAEAEILATAARALTLMGLSTSDFVINVNSRALLSELLVSKGISPDHHAATFLALDKRGKISDTDIAELLAKEGVGDDATSAIFDLLGLTSLEEVAAVVGESVAVTQLRDLMGLLDTYGIADVVRFDLSVIRGLSYYTGIVFEAFDSGQSLRAIFGGGRYDDLLATVGGKPMTGVGLGFGDVVIAELLKDKGITLANSAAPDIAIGYMTEAERLTATRQASRMRADGKKVALGLSPEKPRKLFSRADNLGAAEALYIGPDDVEKGAMRIKTLADGEQRTVAIS